MSLEQAPHQEQNPQDANIFDVEKMIESIQDPKEREAARALLAPKKLTEEEKASRKARLQTNREAIQAAESDQQEKARLLRALDQADEEKGTTQPLTREEKTELDKNVAQQKELIAKLEKHHPQTPPLDVTQALNKEEKALLKQELREEKARANKKVSFFSLKRWFN